MTEVNSRIADILAWYETKLKDQWEAAEEARRVWAICERTTFFDRNLRKWASVNEVR